MERKERPPRGFRLWSAGTLRTRLTGLITGVDAAHRTASGTQEESSGASDDGGAYVSGRYLLALAFVVMTVLYLLWSLPVPVDGQ